MGNQTTHICIDINGKEYSSYIPCNLTLLDFLRESIGFMGAKKGCDSGHCGACTVLLEGYCVYTNSLVSGAVRGYGNSQMTFASSQTYVGGNAIFLAVKDARER